MLLLSAASLLLACVEPPVIDPVTDTLSDHVVASAEPELRLFIGLAGVIAETCVVDRMSEYTFAGQAAAALGVTQATVTESESGAKTWAFSGVGLDGADGTLVFTTDSDRMSFSTAYTDGAELRVSGEYHLVDCVGGASDTASSGADPVALVSGNIDVAGTNATHHLYIDGSTAYAALNWEPPTALAPTAGWAHWGDDASRPTEELLLDDASGIDAAAGTWPGTATGSGWSKSVSVGLP